VIKFLNRPGPPAQVRAEKWQLDQSAIADLELAALTKMAGCLKTEPR
jgi:hypothetical protein